MVGVVCVLSRPGSGGVEVLVGLQELGEADVVALRHRAEGTPG